MNNRIQIGEHEFYVIETRVYLTTETDLPIVNKVMEKLAMAKEFKDLCHKVSAWMKTMELKAVEFDPNTGYLKVDKKGLVLECEFANDEGGRLTPAQVKIAESLLFK